MSTAQDIATKARHRGLTPWQLVQKIGRLERALNRAKCDGIELATANADLKAERNQLEAQLDEAGIALSGAREDLVEQTAELNELRAFKANAAAVTVPPAERQVDPDDQPTHPTGIDVRDLRDRFTAGPVVDLHHSQQAVTNPGQTAWGASREAGDPAA